MTEHKATALVQAAGAMLLASIVRVVVIRALIENIRNNGWIELIKIPLRIVGYFLIVLTFQSAVGLAIWALFYSYLPPTMQR